MVKNRPHGKVLSGSPYNNKIIINNKSTYASNNGELENYIKL